MPIATSGNDSLTGTAWNDSISGLAGNDTLRGNDGNDDLYGGAGADSLYGDNGNDAVSGGIGNDLVDGGAGLDDLVGGQGTDTLYGGSGNDILLGDGQWLSQASYASGILGLGTTLTVTNSADGPITLDWIDTQGTAHQVATIAAGQTYAVSTLSSNNFILKDEHGYFLEPITGALSQTVTYGPNLGDVLYGGANDDSMLGQYGDDTLYGDDGNDTVEGGAGNDSIFGGVGHDSLEAETGNDLIYGGAGNDIVWSGLGNDALSGDAGDDFLLGEAQDDQLYGGTGNDSLDGGADNDRLYGGSGTDGLCGGSGNDTLAGGAGDDSLTGGAGNDYFAFDSGGGHDLVSDFDMSLGGGHTADQLDVLDLRNADGSPVRPWDITVSDDGCGQALLRFPGGESVVLGGVSPAQVAQQGMLHSMGVPCFAAGTRILTPRGERLVEDIVVGDLVTTAAGQALPVLWHGQRRIDDLATQPQNQPIRLAAGGFGNRRDLLLSPQHGVYLPQAAALIRARHLVGISPRVRVAKGIQSISYHHLLLSKHSLLLAEGAMVESFYPGAMALAALSITDRTAVRAAILALCPLGVANTSAERSAAPSLTTLYGPRCVPLLPGAAARCFARPEPALLALQPRRRAGFGNQLALSLSTESTP